VDTSVRGDIRRVVTSHKSFDEPVSSPQLYRCRLARTLTRGGWVDYNERVVTCGRHGHYRVGWERGGQRRQRNASWDNIVAAKRNCGAPFSAHTHAEIRLGCVHDNAARKVPISREKSGRLKGGWCCSLGVAPRRKPRRLIVS
jgi:hypothetical protein